MKASCLVVLLGVSTFFLLSCDRRPEEAQSEGGGTAAEGSAAQAAGEAAPGEASRVESAVAVLSPVGGRGVTGTVRFSRTDAGAVRIHGKITGLSPGAHGFHVHQFGDLSSAESGKSAGGHFAPKGMPHGAPDAEKRHVGDLGNITADEEGIAMIDKLDTIIELSGPHSIVGRALVVHEKADSFTQPSGEAGARVAFGVIGVSGGAPSSSQMLREEEEKKAENEPSS